MERRRYRVACAAAFALLVVVAIGCTSPGQAYGYLDVKFSGVLAATPAQPAVNKALSLGFTIRNTYNQPLSGITYRVFPVTSLTPTLTLGTQIGTDVTVSIPAYGSLYQTAAIPAQATAGDYSYAVVLDQSNTIAEQDETNNTAVITLTVADLDIAFGTPSASVDTPPVSPGNLTLHFVITNTANADAAAPLPANVTYVITIDADPTPIVTTPGTPASPATVATGTSVPVTVTVPRPAGPTAVSSHTYTITLSSSVTESSTTNNTAIATVPVAN